MAQSEFNVKRTARLARLELTAEEEVTFGAQLGKILDYVAALESHDLDGVEPTAHAMPVHDVWREDIPQDSFTEAEALANAPRKSQGQIQITRVVEE